MGRLDLNEITLKDEINNIREIKTFLSEELTDLSTIIICAPSNELLQARIRLKETLMWIDEHLKKYES